jgi:hypothetical protein
MVRNYEDNRAKADEGQHLELLAGLIEQGLRTAMNANPQALAGLDAEKWAAIIAGSL